MSTHFDQLQVQLQNAPFLVANGATGQVDLVDEAKALRLMNEAGLFHSQVVMNAERALQGFAILVGKEDRRFSLKDIAQITGTPYSQAYGWVRDDVIVPSIRKASGSGKGKEPVFSWRDAFAAGVNGSLRRQGIGLDTLREVQQLFANQKKKRSTKKASTSSST